MTSCIESDVSIEYEKWIEYFESYGIEKAELDNSVALILRTHECNPSVEEILWWRDNYETLNVNQILLIIETRLPSVANAFIETHKLDFIKIIDDEFLISKTNLVASTPKKILFGESDIVKSDGIGTGSHPITFISH